MQKQLGVYGEWKKQAIHLRGGANGGNYPARTDSIIRAVYQLIAATMSQLRDLTQTAVIIPLLPNPLDADPSSPAILCDYVITPFTATR